MTEEKKKPEEDEVTDEQLEDVSGGNLASKGSWGAAFPDLCVTPEGEAGTTPITGGSTGRKADPTKGTKDTGDVTGNIIPELGINSLDDGITRL